MTGRSTDTADTTPSGTDDTADTVDTAGPEGAPADPLGDPFALDPIPLPESRGGGRVQLRRRRRRQQRQRYLGAGGVLVLVVAALLVRAGGGGGGDGGTDRGDPPPAAPVLAAPVLVAQQDASGRASSLTVLVPAPGGGGNLLLIPPGTMTEVVSLGLEPVSRSLELGGPSRLHATVENLLGAGIAEAVVVDDPTLAGLLEPVGPLVVQVPERVEEVDPNGRVRVLFEAGPATVPPAEAAAFLAARGRGNDLARLTRHQAFFDSWLKAVRERPGAAPAKPPALAKAFDALVSGTVRTRVLPVEAFGTAAAEGELYRVREAELSRLVATVFPDAGETAAGPRPRVQVLNGTGAVGLADAVRNKLGAGFDVRLAGNAARFDKEKTEVVFYDRQKRQAAERVKTALGVGELVFSRNPLDVVDVTIIVGKDFSTE